MKWLVLIALTAIAATNARAEDPFACVKGNDASKGIFTFDIWRAFTVDNATTSFRLCELSSKSFLRVQIKSEKKLSVRTVDLSKEQVASLHELYDAALGVNFKDDTSGTDGSGWCLEANRMNYLKACFYTPTYNSHERGIAPFVALGTALWEMAQFGNGNGELR